MASSRKRAESPTSVQGRRAKSSRVQGPAEEEEEEDAKALIEALDQAEKEAGMAAADASSTAPQVSPAGGVSLAAASAGGNSAQIVPPAGPSAAKLEAYALESDLLSVERQTMDVSWFGRLESEMKKPYFSELKRFLIRELSAGKVIYPPPSLVHSWSRCTPLERVKVVVVGQDPYHGPGQACGHSFSVPRNVAVPGSLKNIYKQLQTEYPDFRPPKHGDLTSWAKQGVLLLNACLTVQAGQAGSHHGKGWEPFTRGILRAVADEAARNGDAVKKAAVANFFAPPANKSKGATTSASKTVTAAKPTATETKKGSLRGVVFLVWGKPAAKMVADAGITAKSPNIHLLHSAHPSPLSAHRGFLGNGHFRATNAYLEATERYGPGGGIKWGDL